MEKNTGYTFKDLEYWKMALGLALASFFIFGSLYTVQPLLPVFVAEFGVSPAVSSLSQSLTMVSLVIGLIVFGFYSDRLGRVRIIQLTLLGSILPYILIPMVDSFSLLLVLRFLQGFALAGLPAAAVAYISEEVKLDNSGLAIAVYIASNALGGMVGRVVTGYMAGAYDWRLAFFLFAGIGLVVFLALFFLLPKSRFFHPTRETLLNNIRNMSRHLSNRLLLPTFGVGFVLQFSFTGVWTYVPFYLQEPPFSLSLQEISAFYLVNVFGVVGTPLGGYLSRKFGLKVILIFGISVFVTGILFSLFFSIFWVWTALSLICLGFFIAHCMASAWVGQKASHHKAGASGLYLVSYYIGVAVGGTLLGSVWTAFNWVGIVVITMALPVLYGLFWMRYTSKL